MTTRAEADVYPEGSILQLIRGDRVTAVTAATLRERAAAGADPPEPAVLNPRELALLSAVAARLIPQTERTAAIDLTNAFHHRLADRTGNGWRFAELPPATELHQRGLAGVDASAIASFGEDFLALPPVRQDSLLRDIQNGRTEEAAWQGMSQILWFREMLAGLVDIFYSHPLAQDEIGYAGMADAHGWSEVGLNSREAHEPMPLPSEAERARS